MFHPEKDYKNRFPDRNEQRYSLCCLSGYCVESSDTIYEQDLRARTSLCPFFPSFADSKSSGV